MNDLGSTSVRNLLLIDVPASKILTKFELPHVMDSFTVHDPRVSHYMTAIVKSPADPQDTEKFRVQIDFSALLQKT